MARTTKKGLSYFPLDVDFFEDDKMELINAEFGIKGESVALRLLCLIYKNGYWYKLGEDETLLLAKRVGNGITGALVGEVVRGLVKRSFFDERVFNSFQILTSKGIQVRYFEAVERRKVVEIIPEIILVPINANIKSKNVNINSLNTGFGTQKRREEKKEEGSAVINDPFFEMFRSVSGKHISDEQLLNEMAKFKNKYPNAHPNRSGALVNAWVANIGKEKPTGTKEMVV